MANKWGIPSWLEETVRERDKTCVYCRLAFDPSIPKRNASWEHIINDATIITEDNIALCCRGCNASKGQKKLQDWFSSNYCKANAITATTVAPVIKNAL